MLKSTHRPIEAPLPLPLGWTEHKAPTGHLYYYHVETKQSTYTRPTTAPLSQHNSGRIAALHSIGVIGLSQASPLNEHLQGHTNLADHQFRSDREKRHGFQEQRRPPQQDRPRSKAKIPGCEPWLIVKTKLGRRFVYNPQDGESFWKFPPEVMKHVIEYDRMERESKERRERGELSEPEDETLKSAPDLETATPTVESRPIMETVDSRMDDDESDEYEDVEVSDDEDEDNSSKRQKIEVKNGEAPIEFDEDDMAYQLAAMGEDYGLDPGEYGDGQGETWEEGAEGLPLTEEDSNALFKDMLNDFRINPYTPWETIIEEGKIIEDGRYTCLPNMKSRKEVWGKWSRERIQQLKDQRESEEKKDPRIPYLAFLQKFASPKLYWPEFRRKYKKEPEMKDMKLSDKDKEKWFRDYINRLKIPESVLKSDLKILLNSIPVQTLNCSTSMEALPPALLTDIRYISLRPQIRDPLIEAFIAISPPAPDSLETSPEDEAAMAKQSGDRKRRERALAQREMAVQEEKRKQRGMLRFSKDLLKNGEEEIQRAMRVGREGLLSHMEVPVEGMPDVLTEQP